MTLLHKLFRNKHNREQLEALEKEGSQKGENAPDLYSSQEQQEDKEENMSPDTGEEYEIVEREILPAKIICPDCGGITLEGLEFCDKCGGELF